MLLLPALTYTRETLFVLPQAYRTSPQSAKCCLSFFLRCDTWLPHRDLSNNPAISRRSFRGSLLSRILLARVACKRQTHSGYIKVSSPFAYFTASEGGTCSITEPSRSICVNQPTISRSDCGCEYRQTRANEGSPKAWRFIRYSPIA